MWTLGIFLTINIDVVQQFFRFDDNFQKIKLDSLVTKNYTVVRIELPKNVSFYYLKFNLFEV